jgi:hypothetical protein
MNAWNLKYRSEWCDIYIYRPKRPAWMGRLDSALNIEKLLNWYADKLIDIATDWWFGTFFIFHILGIIIPTDFHIFQRGRYTTNQANARGRVQCIYNGWPTRVLSPKLGFDFADRGWSPPSDLSSDHYSKPHLFCHFICVDGPCSPCWICGFHDECCGKSDFAGRRKWSKRFDNYRNVWYFYRLDLVGLSHFDHDIIPSGNLT